MEFIRFLANWLRRRNVLTARQRLIFVKGNELLRSFHWLLRRRLHLGCPSAHVAWLKALESARYRNVFALAPGFTAREYVMLEQLGKSLGRRVVFVTHYDTKLRDKLAARGLRALDLKDVWTDTAADILIHEQIDSWWKYLSKELFKDGLASEDIEVFRPRFWTDAVAQGRMAKAAKRLLGEGGEVVVFAVQPGTQEMRARYLITAMAGAYSAQEFELTSNASGLWAKATPLDGIPHLFPAIIRRNRLKSPNQPCDSAMQISGEQARPGGYDGPSNSGSIPRSCGILLALCMPSDSIYWASTCALVKALRVRFPAIQVVSNLQYTRNEERELGVSIRTLSLPRRSANSTVASQIVGRVRSAICNILVSDCAIENPLGSPEALAAFAWLEYAIDQSSLATLLDWRQQILAIARAGNAKAILCFPHFCDFGYVALTSARLEEIPSISAPLVTIAANQASLVGWDLVDYVACYGEQCADAFRGVYSDHPVPKVVGNLFADLLLGVNAEERREAVLKSAHLPPLRTLVLVATSHIDPDEIAWIRDLASWCAERRDVGLIVKVHPSFPLGIYAGVDKAGRGYARLLDSRIPLQELLAAATCCITDFSTVGSYAVMAGKPLIVANMKNFTFPANDYVEYGVAWPARTSSELVDVLARVMNASLPLVPSESGKEGFLKAHSAFNDGGTGNRYADFISAIIGYATTTQDQGLRVLP